jgi:hypothetical protein
MEYCTVDSLTINSSDKTAPGSLVLSSSLHVSRAKDKEQLATTIFELVFIAILHMAVTACRCKSIGSIRDLVLAL